MPLHLPPSKRPSELQRYTALLELELENRLDLADESMTPNDAVAMVLSAIVAARRQMGW